MQERHPVPAAEMVRIPGLYRRWELPEVLKNHQAYRIEDAGAHQDGTPLLAVYAAGDSDEPKDPGAIPSVAALRTRPVGPAWDDLAAA